MLYASLTLAPSVRSVTILCHSAFTPEVAQDANLIPGIEFSWKSLADQIKSRSRNVSSLSINVWSSRGSVPSGILVIVNELCQGLASLTAFSVPQAFIPPPFHLPPRVENLELFIPRRAQPAEGVDFANLHTLQLSAASVEHCTAFLRALRARNLQRFAIHYSSGIANKSVNLRDTFTALNASDSSNLTTIAIQGDKIGIHEMYETYVLRPTPPRTSFPLSYSVLEPLISYKDMTSLTIANCIPTEISNGDLLSLLSAWPNLEVLNLSSAFQANTVPKITMAGLHAALLRCPHLSHLDLPCDARTLPSTTTLQPHPALTHWNACDSSLLSPKEAAKTILACFPKLRVLRFFEDMCAKLTQQDYDYDAVDATQVASFMHWREVQEVLFGERI
jgi:hypothetical protein